MVDIPHTLKNTYEHLRSCLESEIAKGNQPKIVFYHTHPNYGQSHVYVKTEDTDSPEDDILGDTIDYVIDYEGWSDEATWWKNEPVDSKVELKTCSGEIITSEDNFDFNRIWTTNLEVILRESIKSLPENLIPPHFYLASDSGEYVADWRTKPKI